MKIIQHNPSQPSLTTNINDWNTDAAVHVSLLISLDNIFLSDHDLFMQILHFDIKNKLHWDNLPALVTLVKQPTCYSASQLESKPSLLIVILVHIFWCIHLHCHILPKLGANQKPFIVQHCIQRRTSLVDSLWSQLSYSTRDGLVVEPTSTTQDIQRQLTSDERTSQTAHKHDSNVFGWLHLW